jgi:hypothetical protein
MIPPTPVANAWALLLIGPLLVCFGAFVLACSRRYYAFNLRMMGRSWGRKYLEAYLSKPSALVTTKVVGGMAILMGILLTWAAGSARGWW